METDEIQAINRIEKETKIQIDLIHNNAKNECKKIIEDAWKKVHTIEFAEREKLNNRLTELKMYRDKEEKRIVAEHILNRYIQNCSHIDNKYLGETFCDTKRQQLFDKIYEILFISKE